MPRTWEEIRRQRWAPQAAMWLVLLATVGLAAAIDHHRDNVVLPPLGKTFTDGVIAYRLPTGWQVIFRGSRDPRVVATAVDRGPQDKPTQEQTRVIAIFRQQYQYVQPEDYLKQTGLVNQLFDPTQFTVVGVGRTPLIGGVQALRLEGATPTQGGYPSRQRMALCTVLPGGQAITITITRYTKLDLSDVALLDTVAANVLPATAPDDPTGVQ